MFPSHDRVGGGLITSRGSISGADSLLNFDVKSDGRLFSRRFGSSAYTGLTGLRDGTWKHLLITLDYSSGDVKYYLNGVQGGNTDNYGGIYSNNILGSIGRGGTLYFGGNIDEVSVFKKVLTSTEISQVYNSGVPNDISSLNPFSWWRFEEGSGTTAKDSGSGGNDGTHSTSLGPLYDTDRILAPKANNTVSFNMEEADIVEDTP